MISAIEWIPVGRANPNPSKYEYSRAERDFLSQLVAAQQTEEEEEGAGAIAPTTNKKDGDDTGSNDDDEWEDVDDEDDDDDDEEEKETGTDAELKETGKLPKVDPSSLPADLRMDEYSDDDDDDDDDGGDRVVGGLLGVGRDAEIMMGVAAFEDDNIDNEKNDDEEFDDSDDDEDDDDLDDAPDTREYMPLDVEGLQSLGIGGTGGGGHKKEGGYTMEDLQNMTMNNADEDDEDDDDQEDVDDIQLRDTDALLVVAKTEEDFASLEINIFDTESSNLYVHHDIPLPSYPLCLALGCVVSSYDSISNNNTARAGNYVAVGSFEPGIEIWNLDVMNALEPTLVLGGVDTSGTEEDWMRMQQTIGQPASITIGGRNNKKHKSKTKKSGSGRGNTGLREGSHTDAVMGLSWNSIHRQVLASASADCTVKLWDVTQATHETYIRPSATLTHHTDKVQSLAWHPTEGTLLATGGYDRRVCLVDARSAAAVSTANNNNNNPSSVKMVKLLADCEALAWDPHNQQYLTPASEDGTVVCYDVRKFNSDPVWSFVAHEYGGVSDIAYNNNIPGMFITCSIDKTVALWDTHQSSTSSSTAPQPCGSKEMSVGKLYSVSCYPSSPWLLACGGSGNELAIWDMEGEEAICNRFASRVIRGGNGGAVASTVEETGPEDFEAIMANDMDTATSKALESMNKSKKKKGKKKSKAHKR